ncbi:phosphoethanolamine transferase [Pseudomonas sp. NCHU5208]|uniref:phosphoethanolamine transferase n=1 Tax=unclassified Pseudomonas TaxID=196821 RepID=UPI003F9A4B93
MSGVRSRIHPEFLAPVAAAVLVLFYNQPLWRHLSDILGGGNDAWPLRLGFGAMLWAIFSLVLLLFSSRHLLKPLLITLFIGSAATLYFMQQYGVLLDRDMLRNVAQTDANEVRDLMSWKLVGYLLLLGVLPSFVLYKLPLAQRSSALRGLVSRVAMAVVATSMLLGVALTQYQGLASLLRNHHELRLLAVPSNYLAAAYGFARDSLVSDTKPWQTIGQDAHRSSAWQQHRRPSLTVLVIGESARADHFGVLGYPRDTTPELARETGLLSFPQVTSCGTETAVSVPCMFSRMSRSDYKAAVAEHQDGLLDLLQRSGLKVAWLDNQSGCKGTCDRVEHHSLREAADARFCADGECHDAILVDGLQQYLNNLQGDNVLILHQMGSHGPDYFKRYPQAFQRFSPICASNALNDCSQQDIINAYDNTIGYTDHVLASAIDNLRAQSKRIDTGLIYLSDHGESLGEYNLYLHGTPYALAPPAQTHIPMLMWFSDGYRQDFALDQNCLRNASGQAYSQDNLFHSMLGLLQVETREYQRNLDLFAGCRKGHGVG